MSNLFNVAQAQSGTRICQVQSRSGALTTGLCTNTPAGTPAPTQPLSYGQGQGTPAPTQPMAVTSTILQEGGQPKWCHHQFKKVVITPIEALICGDTTLSALDIQLNNLAGQLTPRPRLAEDRDLKVATFADKRTPLVEWYNSAIQQLSQQLRGGNAQGQVAYSANAPTGGGMSWKDKPNLTQSEQVLCQMALQYPELVTLDDALTNAYKAKLHGLKNKAQRKALQAKQRAALAERDQKIATGNAQGVIAYYSKMVGDLQQ